MSFVEQAGDSIRWISGWWRLAQEIFTLRRRELWSAFSEEKPGHTSKGSLSPERVNPFLYDSGRRTADVFLLQSFHGQLEGLRQHVCPYRHSCENSLSDSMIHEMLQGYRLCAVKKTGQLFDLSDDAGLRKLWRCLQKIGCHLILDCRRKTASIS